MKMKLKRRYFCDAYTIGTLYINGVRFCDTLEDANRDINHNGTFDNGEQKIMHRTAIPFGTYNVIVSYSPKFRRYLPRLQNVPHFSGILIHRGNAAEDTSGCILVGENTIKGKVTKSTPYEKEITKLCQQAANNHETITIEII